MKFLNGMFEGWLAHLIRQRVAPPAEPAVKELLRITFHAGATAYQEAAKDPKRLAEADHELKVMEEYLTGKRLQ